MEVVIFPVDERLRTHYERSACLSLIYISIRTIGSRYRVPNPRALYTGMDQFNIDNTPRSKPAQMVSQYLSYAH